jgi:chaperonin GroEL (HSP60 family)
MTRLDDFEQRIIILDSKIDMLHDKLDYLLELYISEKEPSQNIIHNIYTMMKQPFIQFQNGFNKKDEEFIDVEQGLIRR